MSREKLTDAEAKSVLLTWPSRTKLWPPPGGRGYWIQGQPRSGNCAGPRISSPGARLFNTQPDGLWVHFQGEASCDVVGIEVCGTVQNLNDKRSRYIPASHSLVLKCGLDWLEEKISVQRGGQRARWDASASFDKKPTAQLSVPVRHLRHYVNRYASVAKDDFERRYTEPIACSSSLFWLYRDRLVKVASKAPVDELPLRIKHKVLNHENALDRLRRDVEAFENFAKLQGVSREPIPDTVRMFVWQRDRGRCTKCGSQERLEYDHIIPIREGRKQYRAQRPASLREL